MSVFRIKEHPILSAPPKRVVNFTWQGESLQALEGETIASALFANGIRTFGHHHKDGAPLGIFCANGQCAQCSVMANGVSVKSCMIPVQENMAVEPLDGKYTLLDVNSIEAVGEEKEVDCVDIECLILGGGPAGLSAAVELAKTGAEIIIVDDKASLGGKLVLQTHKFFGSVAACHAGTRGMDIGINLENEAKSYSNIHIWNNSNALAVFSDNKVGIIKNGKYTLVSPKVLLVATGAREKSLVFKGNSLPGVYGAGAFQTMVNRDMVRPTKRLFIIGGGNVGLIAAYHALQAGIEVVGLCEFMPACGGYKVHKDKIVRMGVPIYTSHTVVSANGVNEVESITIAQLGPDRKPMAEASKTFVCDTILVAVGLEPVNEFYIKAKEFGLPVFVVGDAEEIAEASVAMFTGKMRGLEIAKFLGRQASEITSEWHDTAAMLKARPGAILPEEVIEDESGVFPVFHCSQEIPCNPCTSICPEKCINIESGDILGVPTFNGGKCIACERCVAICPGLAITLVDYREQLNEALVTIPYEFSASTIKVGQMVTVLDTIGNVLGDVPVVGSRAPKFANNTVLVKVKAPLAIAKKIAGIQVQSAAVGFAASEVTRRLEDDEIVCRCERVTAGEIRRDIRAGVRDMNALKGLNRSGMGACGGKTCPSLIMRIFSEEGVPLSEVTELTSRPLFMEVPMGVFAGMVNEDCIKDGAKVDCVDGTQGGCHE